MSVCCRLLEFEMTGGPGQNPLVVEAPKAHRDRGKYLHPELHGKKKEAAIGWIPIPKRRAAEPVSKKEASSKGKVAVRARLYFATTPYSEFSGSKQVSEISESAHPSQFSTSRSRIRENSVSFAVDDH